MVSLNIFFHLEQHFFSRIDSFQCYFHVSNLIQTVQTDLFESSTQYSLVTQKSCSLDYHVSYHNRWGTLSGSRCSDRAWGLGVYRGTTGSVCAAVFEGYFYFILYVKTLFLCKKIFKYNNHL